MRNILRKINSKDVGIGFESTVVGNIPFQGKTAKRVSFVSHLLLLSLLISFTTSANTTLAVASLFSKPPLNKGGSTRWESTETGESAWLPKVDCSSPKQIIRAFNRMVCTH